MENEAQQDVFAKHSKVLNKEKEKIAEVQIKEDNYRQQHNVLTKEIK